MSASSRRIVVFTLAMLLTIATWWALRSLRQREIVASFAARSAVVKYWDVPVTSDERLLIPEDQLVVASLKLRSPIWEKLSEAVGRDGVYAVRVIGVDNASSIDVAAVRNLPLQCLALERGSIGDADLDVISTMSTLEALVLRDTLVTDSGMRAIAKMNNLRHLDVRGTKVTSRGIEALSALEYLEMIEVDGPSN